MKQGAILKGHGAAGKLDRAMNNPDSSRLPCLKFTFAKSG